MISTSNDYAAAIFMLAVAEGKLIEFADDLAVVKRVFKENPDYVLLLNSPGISKDERLSAIDSAFNGNVNEYVVNFIKVLATQGKTDLLGECIDTFYDLKKQAENRVTAHVYSAVVLDDEQISRLKTNLQNKLGVSVKIKTYIDKNMLGGIKVKFEDKLIDGSVKQQLREIKEVISG